MSAARIVWTGFVVNLKMLGTSSFFLLTSIVQPIIFATIAFYMYQSGNRPGTLLYAALGAGMMGVWSTTLFGSGGMIQWQRWQGTLELGVGAPPPGAPRAPAVLARERLHGAVRAGRHAGLGTAPLRRAAALRAPVAVRRRASRDRDRPRADGPRPRLDVHSLPLRERALEPARVPGL